MKVISISIYLTLATFFTGCQLRKQTDQVIHINVPSKYHVTRSDSLNIAAISWRQFFRDPNLTTLIDTALTRNPELLSAMQRIEASRAEVRAAKGSLFPAISANAAYWHRKFGLYTMDGAGNITTPILPGEIVPIHLPDYYVGLQAAWEADVWGKLKNRRKAALMTYLGTVEGKNLVLTNLIADVAYSYYELLALDNQLEVVKENVTIQAAALEVVKVQKESAAASELAVKQFSAQVLNSRAIEFEILQQIREVENRINFLIGRYGGIIPRDKESLFDSVAFKSHAGVPSQLLKNRPDIRQAEFELLASGADVRAAKAAFYPSLNLTGLFGYQAFKPDLLFKSPESIVYSLLGNMVAPLFNRSAIKAAYQSANARQKESLFNYQKAVLTGFIEVSNELYRIESMEKVAALKLAESNVLAEAIETSNELFSMRRANYLEVLTTQAKVLEARMQIISAKQNQFSAQTALYKALGGGWR